MCTYTNNKLSRAEPYSMRISWQYQTCQSTRWSDEGKKKISRFTCSGKEFPCFSPLGEGVSLLFPARGRSFTAFPRSGKEFPRGRVTKVTCYLDLFRISSFTSNEQFILDCGKLIQSGAVLERLGHSSQQVDGELSEQSWDQPSHTQPAPHTSTNITSSGVTYCTHQW